MTVRILVGDCIESMRRLPSGSAQCCVTSPPYWGLLDYGVEGQIGLEATPAEYVEKMVAVFREVRRVLRDDGTLWLNLGDCYANTGKSGGGAQGERWQANGGRTDDCKGTFKYAPPGLKPKDLVGIPWRVAFALQADGWWLRSDIVWAKPNCMPESVTDRPTRSHEYVFLLTKAERYFYDAHAIREAFADARQGRDGGRKPSERNVGGRADGFTTPSGIDPSANGGRNSRSVWTINPQPFPEAHFATFPPGLPERCIKAGTSEKGCCAACGASIVREVARERTFESGSGRAGTLPEGKNGEALQGGGATLDIRRGPCVAETTTGWEPGCACGAETARSLALDPFGGAGTTALVAQRLDRDAVICELSPEYVEIARARIVGDAPMFATVSVEPAPVDSAP